MRSYFRKIIAIPQDHGSWVFILSPLLIGFFVSGGFSTTSVYLIIAAMAAFFIRQPVTIATKAYAGRRPRTDLPAARFWILIYGTIALVMLIGLVVRGFENIIYLAVPGMAIFVWHLALVRKRDERKQAGLEIVASGALALAAPAALWVGKGSYDPTGWTLWILVWLQSAASIVHAYMRLEHRSLPEVPERSGQFEIGKRAIQYTSFNFVGTLLFGIIGWLPQFIFIPFLLQLAETLWWTFNPALKTKPTSVGFRQLAVSNLFIVLFILFW